MEKFLTIYQKPKKGKTSTKVRERERYHRYVALGKRPTRYTKYRDMTDEQYNRHIDGCRESRMRRYHKDPAFKRKLNKLRTLQSLRARQRKDGRTKMCNKCNKQVPHCDFERRSGQGADKDMLRYECKKCRKQRNADYYQRVKKENR